jgi:hypothetical protein
MNLDQDVTGLETQMAAVGAELSRKRQEVAFLEASESDRVGRQEEAAEVRLGGRQAGSAPNPTGDVVVKRGGRRK